MYRPSHSSPRVLIIYYSLSGQSRALINLFAAGLRDQGISVFIEQIQTVHPIGFPFGSVSRTIWMMIKTFFRARLPIKEPSAHCHLPYHLIVLAGPTWSYNPSGPILSVLDRYGKRLFREQKVLPLISCRGYYRWHNYTLRRMLTKLASHVEPSIIFRHPVSEPWSSIGVFLKSIGLHPEKIRFLATHYQHYGHTREQLLEARTCGVSVGRELMTALFPEQGSCSGEKQSEKRSAS